MRSRHLASAYSPAIANLYWRQRRELSGAAGALGRPGSVWPSWLGFTALFAVVSVLQVFTARQPGPLPGWEWRTALLVAVGMLVMSPALVGVWVSGVVLGIVRETVFDLRSHPAIWNHRHAGVVERLRRIPIVLQRLLLTASAAVSAVTLSTGALRSAVTALPGEPPWPAADVLLYGGLFAVLLALSYLPAAVRLQDTRRALVDAVRPVPREQPDTEWYEHREHLEKLVALDDQRAEGLPAVIAVVAPLITSLASVLLAD